MSGWHQHRDYPSSGEGAQSPSQDPSGSVSHQGLLQTGHLQEDGALWTSSTHVGCHSNQPVVHTHQSDCCFHTPGNFICSLQSLLVLFDFFPSSWTTKRSTCVWITGCWWISFAPIWPTSSPIGSLWAVPPLCCHSYGMFILQVHVQCAGHGDTLYHSNPG